MQLELTLEARLAPSEGLLAIEGRLTERSYVLHPRAKVRGGFAFYVWFDGDFVLSIGGYHPRFVKPAHVKNISMVQARPGFAPKHACVFILAKDACRAC